MSHAVIHADALTYLRGNRWLVQNGYLPRAHAVLCDPPYGLAFMGKHWDTLGPVEFQVWVTEWAGLLIDYVYPGALGLFFGGTRTYHRLAAGLEDAGWEITDSMCVWVHAQGFPKSASIGKLLDKEAGAAREVVGGVQRKPFGYEDRPWKHAEDAYTSPITAPATPLAARWDGYGTALKPSWESVVVCRAPRGKHTYAALAREFGTGALNIDGSRIGVEKKWDAQPNHDTTPASIAARNAKPTDPGQSASSVTGNAAPISNEKAKARPEATSRTDTECFDGQSPAERSASQSPYPDSNTTKYGKTPTVPFLPDTSFTTSTATNSTTDWQTSNSWNGDGIPHSTTETPRNTPTAERPQTTSEPITTDPEYANAAPHGSASIGASARWPANFALVCACEGDDHADDCPVYELGRQSGELTSGKREPSARTNHDTGWHMGTNGNDASVGTAARFFMTAKAERECWLCGSPVGVERIPKLNELQEDRQWQPAHTAAESSNHAAQNLSTAHDNARGAGSPVIGASKQSRNGHAPTAESGSKNTPPTGIPTAGKNAPTLPNDPLDRLVQSAGNLCGSCATAIAQSIAQMRRGQIPDTQAIAVCMPAHNAQILTRNLARIAGLLANTDITKTTDALMMWFGFVRDAIANTTAGHGSASEQSTFRYQSKAAAWEREAGLHGFAKRPMREPGAEFGKMTMWNGENGDEAWRAKNPNTPRANVHPTVKPIRLAEYLARLILPPELDTPRRLLVPFAGSGSEMIGARLAGWDAVTGIERESEYVALAEARLAWWAQFATYEDARAAYEKERKAKPALVVIEDKPEQIALFPADEEAS